MGYILHVFDPNIWDMKMDGTPYLSTPKKYMPLCDWAKTNGADYASNMCFFNFPSAKYYPLWTLQYLYILRLHAKCGDGDASTPEHISLPNGDIISGWNENTKHPKDPLIEFDSIHVPEKRNRSSHSLFGITTDGRYFIAKSGTGYLQDQFASYIVKDIVGTHRSHVKTGFEMDGGGSTGVYSSKTGLLYTPTKQKEGVKGRYLTTAFLASVKPSYRIARTLKYGSIGEDVKVLQILLGLDADGIFGSNTRLAVIAYQKANGLDPDGIAGPLTLGKMGLWGGK